jgi:hypothetical protein
MQFEIDEFYIFDTSYHNIRRSGIPKRYPGKRKNFYYITKNFVNILFSAAS